MAFVLPFATAVLAASMIIEAAGWVRLGPLLRGLVVATPLRIAMLHVLFIGGFGSWDSASRRTSRSRRGDGAATSGSADDPDREGKVDHRAIDIERRSAPVGGDTDDGLGEQVGSAVGHAVPEDAVLLILSLMSPLARWICTVILPLGPKPFAGLFADDGTGLQAGNASENGV